jgi:hypothetical protein
MLLTSGCVDPVLELSTSRPRENSSLAETSGFFLSSCPVSLSQTDLSSASGSVEVDGYL